eukprot:982856-Prymnesium_polylepis.1
MKQQYIDHGEKCKKYEFPYKVDEKMKKSLKYKKSSFRLTLPQLNVPWRSGARHGSGDVRLHTALQQSECTTPGTLKKPPSVLPPPPCPENRAWLLLLAASRHG